MSATIRRAWPRGRATSVAPALLALAAVAWWATDVRMDGMDAGPGTPLGGLGWFAVSWTLMMAAMMLPSLAPVAAGPAGVRRRARGHSLPLAAGYLAVWSVAGVGAYLVFEAGRHVLGGPLAWSHGGRAAANAVLAAAALYELSPAKRACLHRCRAGLGTSFADGVRAGCWFAGCCWALMAALFALGVMSLTWMALVAVLVLLQKAAPWPRAATAVAAGVLLALAVGIAAAPGRVPGLVVPSGASMQMNEGM